MTRTVRGGEGDALLPRSVFPSCLPVWRAGRVNAPVRKNRGHDCPRSPGPSPPAPSENPPIFRNPHLPGAISADKIEVRKIGFTGRQARAAYHDPDDYTVGLLPSSFRLY